MRILAPVCPGCAQPPGLALSAEQVFCGNRDCAVFCWNMTMDPIEQFANQTAIELDLSVFRRPDEDA